MNPVSGLAHPYAADDLARRAARVMPRGNTRTTLYVPPTPPYAVLGDGCRVTDQTGHQVLDCNNNYTSLIHGHSHPAIVEAVTPQLSRGTAFGLPTESEVMLAELLAARTGLRHWRFSNSGSEAVMTAVRASRAATGRSVIVRFKGSYHGTYDGVVESDAAGMPSAIAQTSVALPQGDLEVFSDFMDSHRGSVAAVLIDLMPNRAGLVPADRSFVSEVRAKARSHGALLIIDEVITFRLAMGGLHSTYGVDPDLVTVGKIIGGGFAIGAVGGTPEVMSVFDPQLSGSVSWGGTFSANPVSMIAGRVALERFDQATVDRLNHLGDELRADLTNRGIAVAGQGSLVRIRENVDLQQLWWRLYANGILAGTNGLLALSTPMGATEARTITDAVEGAVRAVHD